MPLSLLSWASSSSLFSSEVFKSLLLLLTDYSKIIQRLWVHKLSIIFKDLNQTVLRKFNWVDIFINLYPNLSINNKHKPNFCNFCTSLHIYTFLSILHRIIIAYIIRFGYNTLNWWHVYNLKQNIDHMLLLYLSKIK